MPLRAAVAHGDVVADGGDAQAGEGKLGGKRRLELAQRREDLPRRDVRRLQFDGGAQQHHLAEGEAVLVARATARRDEAGSDQAGDDAAREAQHLLDGADRVRARVRLGRHFLARVRAGGASSTLAARLTPLRSFDGAAETAAGSAAFAGAVLAGAAVLPLRPPLPRLARNASTRSITCAPPDAGSCGSLATICLPAIFSSIAARIRFFSSSSNIVGSYVSSLICSISCIASLSSAGETETFSMSSSFIE